MREKFVTEDICGYWIPSESVLKAVILAAVDGLWTCVIPNRPGIWQHYIIIYYQNITKAMQHNATSWFVLCWPREWFYSRHMIQTSRISIRPEICTKKWERSSFSNQNRQHSAPETNNP